MTRDYLLFTRTIVYSNTSDPILLKNLIQHNNSIINSLKSTPKNTIKNTILHGGTYCSDNDEICKRIEMMGNDAIEMLKYIRDTALKNKKNSEEYSKIQEQIVEIFKNVTDQLA
jgi:hypothetical protein